LLMCILTAGFISGSPSITSAGDFEAMARRCAPNIHPGTLRAVVTTESSHNPFAIGVVGGYLSRQPGNVEEALEVVKELEAQGFNYSLGISQVNKKNLKRVGLDLESAFDQCKNLRAGGQILQDCYLSAKQNRMNDSEAMQAALSCYYSGNFTTGIRLGYADKVIAAATGNRKRKAIRVIRSAKYGEKRATAKDSGSEQKVSDHSLVF
jgi:type IV secretion system protein VirB1